MKKLEHIEENLAVPERTVRGVLELLNGAQHQFCLVIDAERRLLGTVTDGDIRRGMLQGVSLDDRVDRCMCRTPRVGRADRAWEHAELLRGLPFLPLLDQDGRLSAVLMPSEHRLGITEAVIMAGGLGQRLGSITATTPKPLLPVAGKPILERILDNLEAAGVGRVWLAVNHMAEQFRVFAERRSGKAEIRLLHESTKLGTAGALGLLPAPPRSPILVLNGDVLTQVNFTALDAFHNGQDLDGTIAVAHHQVRVPYGVVRHDEGGLFTGVEEKPTLTHFVAAGIYYLSPKVVALVPRNARTDMPDLLNEAQKVGMRFGLFPIHEYWADVGHPEDLAAVDAYHKANTP